MLPIKIILQNQAHKKRQDKIYSQKIGKQYQRCTTDNKLIKKKKQYNIIVYMFQTE